MITEMFQRVSLLLLCLPLSLFSSPGDTTTFVKRIISRHIHALNATAVPLSPACLPASLALPPFLPLLSSGHTGIFAVAWVHRHTCTPGFLPWLFRPPGMFFPLIFPLLCLFLQDLVHRHRSAKRPLIVNSVNTFTHFSNKYLPRAHFVTSIALGTEETPLNKPLAHMEKDCKQ